MRSAKASFRKTAYHPHRKKQQQRPRQGGRGNRVREKFGGLQYAESRMEEIKDAAIAMLAGIPDSPYKTSLIDLVNFTTERKY